MMNIMSCQMQYNRHTDQKCNSKVFNQRFYNERGIYNDTSEKKSKELDHYLKNVISVPKKLDNFIDAMRSQ